MSQLLNIKSNVTENLRLWIHFGFNLVISTTNIAYFSEPDQEFDSYLYDPPPTIPLISGIGSSAPSAATNTTTNISENIDVPLIVTEENSTPLPGPAMPIAHVIKSLIRFLSQESSQPLWNYEDITAKGLLVKNYI